MRGFINEFNSTRSTSLWEVLDVGDMAWMHNTIEVAVPLVGTSLGFSPTTNPHEGRMDARKSLNPPILRVFDARRAGLQGECECETVTEKGRAEICATLLRYVMLCV